MLPPFERNVYHDTTAHFDALSGEDQLAFFDSMWSQEGYIRSIGICQACGEMIASCLTKAFIAYNWPVREIEDIELCTKPCLTAHQRAEIMARNT